MSDQSPPPSTFRPVEHGSPLDWRANYQDDGPHATLFQGTSGMNKRGQKIYFEAFEYFKQKMEEMLATYTIINPLKNEMFAKPSTNVSNDYGMELIRGGIVRLIALFEGFVKEVLREIFYTELLENACSLQELKEIWPNCRKAIQSELEKKVTNKSVNEWSAKTFEVLLEKDAWYSLSDGFLESTLQKMRTPCFHDPKSKAKDDKEIRGIDVTFNSLFQKNGKEKSISQMMIDTEISILFMTGSDEIKVILNDPKQLRDISLLFYGVRCLFAHGDSSLTFKGALKDLPSGTDLLGKEYEAVGNFLVSLYERAKNYESEAHVSYLTWVNMARFYKAVSHALSKALRSYIENSLGKK